jgi:dTDP-4-dehydrorhamnose reductase
MRVLVTGAGGQVGLDVVDVLSGCLPQGGAPALFAPLDGYAFDVLPLTHSECSVTDADAVHRAVEAYRPHVIIHTAAYTAVDRAEAEPDLAMAVNGTATGIVAAAATAVGARLITISTDYVFDGTASTPYSESAPTNPLSVYGATKLAGEQCCPANGLIVRTSWVAGVHGNNIVKTILRLAAAGTQMSFVDDQHGCPTLAPDLAITLVRLALTDATGIVNVTNDGATTWFTLARTVVSLAGYDPELVQPIATADRLPAPAATRPMYSVLDGARLAEIGLGPLPAWGDSLARVVRILAS